MWCLFSLCRDLSSSREATPRRSWRLAGDCGGATGRGDPEELRVSVPGVAPSRVQALGGGISPDPTAGGLAGDDWAVVGTEEDRWSRGRGARRIPAEDSDGGVAGWRHSACVMHGQPNAMIRWRSRSSSKLSRCSMCSRVVGRAHGEGKAIVWRQ